MPRDGMGGRFHQNKAVDGARRPMTESNFQGIHRRRICRAT
jgi:hypothetical protein